MTMLAVRDLTIDYGRVRAVTRATLEVRAGEIVAVLGANGAGKSSLLHAICGVVRPSAGEVELEGRSLRGMRAERIVRQGISLVPEGRHVFARLTVAENLLLGSTPLADRSHAREDRDRVLERFPAIARYLSSPAGRLSGGEQQQLVIARALLSHPKLLVLDEPSLGLAPLVVQGVLDALGELRAEGMTILLVEQNATKALELADRAYLMANGVASAYGVEHSREELMSAYFGSRP